jgi:predicted kinase
MPKIIMYKGLPGSGKSTRAKGYILKNPKRKTKRINKDDLRAMMDVGKWSKDNEKFVIATRDSIAESALEKGYDVIIDDTNLAPKHKTHLQQMARRHGAGFEEIFVNTSLKECITNDLKRFDSVGKDVIMKMYNQFLRPIEEPYIGDNSLPKAYIFDIDGTLAKMDGRSPFDWSAVGEDKPNESVVDVAKTLKSAGYKIVCLSGRDGSCKQETAKWLLDNGIEYDELILREEGNCEKDDGLKKRLFTDDVAPYYNVQAVFDDRDQVVEMWRSIGLVCMQVDYGDF